MTEYLSIGILLGISAGVAPGPLLTLVISETLQHGMKSGIKVALSPLVTDLPIILLTLFVAGQLAEFHTLLGIISLIGGSVILYMAYQGMNPKVPVSELPPEEPRSLTKGILVNALSPHPYLFWFSVGGPIMSKAMNLNMAAPFAFIGSFYILLVGSKILLAILVGKSRSFLSGTVYIYTIRLLGLALFVLALLLFRDGLILLDVIHID
ncbi:putative threonine efflux protein [Solemya velum gill symbiont]|uniref:Putative threonine efflux protein n=1 Tax=Solemya velum gill symbiont TaxID=2340 RepID=A0A0B0HAS0_SOVGS|nr:LysE family translocator [Solemya velum gill symbiont]KHF24944.1 putative threonine efflux protein [Solemya velum gill symbiont]